MYIIFVFMIIFVWVIIWSNITHITRRRMNMNLLTVLLLSLLSAKSLGALSNNTGVNQIDLKKLLILALPLIIKYMTNNSQSQSGLSSLFGALGAHQNRGSVESQIADADTEDGQKIIGHILGDDKDQVVDELSRESGVDAGDVLNVLGTIAPYIMSGLSAATESAQSQQAAPAGGFDLGGLMSMFGAQPQQEPEPAAPSSVDGSQLLNALLSMMK